MFAYDGSMPPLDEYLSLIPAKGLLLVDDAHSAGVVSEGRGTVDLFALPRERVAQTVTFSKAFGSFGGAILCSDEVRRLILSDSPLFTGSTPVPLPMAAATLEALRIISDESHLHERLAINVNLVRSALGLSTCNSARINPILAIFPEDRKQKEYLHAALQQEGVYPSLIRYPGAPKAEFFRFAISSQHTRNQLRQLVMAIKNVGETTITDKVFT